jgi:hypothetical protein
MYQPPPPTARNNTADRHRWWSAPGYTLEVLAHIKAGNYLVLGMPLP